MSSVSLWLTRLSRHIGIYAVGSVVNVLVGLVSVAVVTRFMPPAGFGQLGILMSFSALLTIAYDMGIMQGTFRRTFGQTDEGDDVGEGDEDVGAGEEDIAVTEAHDKRRALGAGVTLCVLITLLGTSIMAIISPELGSLLLGDSGAGGLVILAGALAATSAVWRMTWNVVRLERRPATYGILGCVRPFLMTGGSIVFLVAGTGVGGVIAGNAIGSLVSVALAAGVSWRSYRPNIDVAAFLQTFRIARRWVPMIIAFWVIHNGDVLLLSRFVSAHDVGVYRLATRIGGTFSFYVGAVMNAWNPLRRTPMFIAARRARGMEIGAELVFYYWLVGWWLLVALAAASGLLVQLGPPSYGAAAGLIPLSGATFVGYGGYMCVYRGSRYRRRSQWHVGITVIAALAFVGSALLLIPAIGAYGAVLASIISFAVAMLITGTQSQRGTNPLPLRYRALAAMFAIGGGCVVLSELVAPLAGRLEPAVDVAAVLLYPVAIVATGLLPLSRLREIGQLVGGALRPGGPDDELRDRVRALAPVERSAIARLVSHRDLAEAVEALAPEDRDAFPARAGGALCAVAEVASEPERDVQVVLYLFGRAPVAHRDLLARGMMAEEVIEPADLAQLESTAERLRKLSAADWSEIEEMPAPAVGPLEVDDEELEALAEGPRPAEPVAARGGGSDRARARAATNGGGNGAVPSSCYGGVLLAAAQPEEPTESAPGAEPDDDAPAGGPAAPVEDDAPADPVDDEGPAGPAAPPDPPEGWIVAPPDFVGIGAGRAGTTRWFDLLVAHPQVRAPISTRKELHFFDRFYDGSATPEQLAEYARYFPRPPGELTGEWSGYMRDFWAPRLIRRAAPDAKLLVSLRDPVERYLSELARARRRRERRGSVRPITFSDMAHRGLYFQQMRHVLRFFDPEQILVLQYEACVEDPERELRRTHEFLGLDYVDPGPEAVAAHPNLGRNREESDLPESLRRELIAFFSTDVRNLARRFPELDLRLWANFQR